MFIVAVIFSLLFPKQVFIYNPMKNDMANDKHIKSRICGRLRIFFCFVHNNTYQIKSYYKLNDLKNIIISTGELIAEIAQYFGKLHLNTSLMM
jgi:hypothetical protein